MDRGAPLIVGLAGASGAGKTTLAEALAQRLGGVALALDHYYRDLSHLPFAERTRANFDDPTMIEDALLARQIAQLQRGESVERPIYEFATHTRRRDRTETVCPGGAVVVEGLFAFCYAELAPLYDLRIYVETPEELCYARRLRRDVQERGRTPEAVRQQYEAMVEPARRRFVAPSARCADLTVNGAGAVEAQLERILEALRARGYTDLFPK